MSEIDPSRPNPPTGELTFLFTDVQGSSALWERDETSMGDALAEHDRRLGESVADHGGYVFTTAGDSFAVAFESPLHAIAAVVDAQLRLREPTEGPEIKVRMGLHSGRAIERDGDYFGPVLNRCARLMSAGHGGQILVSGTTAALIRGELGDDLALLDLGEHRLKDLTELEHIFQLAHPELDREFPPLRTADALTTKLPTQLTSFVGRQQELAEVETLLAEARLVTLAGPGGAGKTRLALQLAADRSPAFPGGVAFVELAAITDEDLVDDAMSTAFGAVEVSGTPLVDSIAAKIGERRLLLVVDNCEHLATRVGSLVTRLLGVCDGLTVLATSQSPLGIRGEIVYRVPSLGVPAPGADIATATSYDAVRLFTERAGLAKPGFVVTADNVANVVEICRVLDGIPLALELAAARLGAFSLDQVASRLDERFRLLRDGPTDADARHRTLEATIAWSYDLLGDDEQRLLRRCSVFAGTFGLDAAERIGDVDDNDDAMLLLPRLVERSLIAAEDDTGRYRLLESIRAYARRKLDADPEADDAPARHLAYFADLAEDLQRRYRSDRLAEALHGLRVDRDNFRAALDAALASGDHEPAGRIVGALGYLWLTDGSFAEGIDWCDRLFATEPDLAPSQMAAALHSYGTLLGSWTDPEAGGGLLEREVELRRELDAPLRLAGALNNLGNMWNDAGRTEQAEAALLEAADILRAAGESTSLTLSALGWGRMWIGDGDAALGFYDEARREAEARQNDFDIAVASASMGQCAAQMGDPDRARPLLDDAYLRFTELGVTPGLLDVEMNMAILERSVGNVAEAAARLLTFLDDPDSHWYLAAKFWVLQFAAGIIADDRVAARLVGAADHYHRSVKLVQSDFVRRDLEATEARLRDRLGRAEFDRHCSDGARRSAAEAVAEARVALAELAHTHQEGPGPC